MTLWWSLGATFLAAALVVRPAGGEPAPADAPTPALPQPSHLASFEDRLAVAESVKVKTDILGVTLNSSLEEAHEKLDKLCAAAHPPKEEEEKSGDEGESGHKVLFELEKTDYSSVFLKTDDKEKVTYILASLRPGKEVPFAQLGQVEKAPVHNDATVAWDLVRPKKPLIRIVGQGANEKARSITLFVVKRH